MTTDTARWPASPDVFPAHAPSVLTNSRPNDVRPHLIVPVENQVRELDAKLLLACVAAERGFRVVLGSRFFVHLALAHLPRGVVIAKSMRCVSRATLELTRRLGHDIVAWDEEGLVRYASPEYCDWRYSRQAFGAVSRLLSWGLDDANLFAGYEGYNGAPIHVTGNPRIDLLRSELRGYFRDEAAALRHRHGDFILVNTNFSFVNAFVPSLNLLQNDRSHAAPRPGRTGAGLSPGFAAGMAAHQQAIYDAFLELMPELSRWFPGRDIVLRPHPSEDHDRWRNATRDLGNVHVIHEGSVVPWLTACRVLLHNGCTTAVEASVLDTAAVAYQPVRSQIYDYHLPNSLSARALCPAQVRAALARALEGKPDPEAPAARRRAFAQHLSATSGPLACDRVVDVLEHAGYLDRPVPPPRRLDHAIGWTGLQARALVQRINMHRRGSRHDMAHHAHRFPGVSLAELNERIGRLGAELNRFSNVRAEQLSAHIFALAQGV